MPAIIKRILLIIKRFITGLNFVFPPIARLFRWLVTSKETTNFTYSLTEKNKKYLAATLSIVTNEKVDKIFEYIHELENDKDLIHHLQTKIRESKYSYKADLNILFARRIGWYVITRILKPKIIIETGVDKGLGSCVLIAGLIQNKKEGIDGYYYGTDINPSAGYLLDGRYKEYGEILYGDSIESLKKFNQKIDLFINDSDHSLEYERREYDVVLSKMAPNGIILSDNAHIGSILYDFSIQNNRKYLYFQEEPKDHWYPGASIGFSWV